jgi:hypothetical protein
VASFKKYQTQVKNIKCNLLRGCLENSFHSGVSAYAPKPAQTGKIPMPTITVDVISVDYSVNYPFLSLAVNFAVPDNIPIIGGKSYYLGGGSIYLGNTQIGIPFEEGPLSASITFNLNASACSFSVQGWIKISPFWYWSIGPGSASYATPFSLAEPPWSSNPVKLDPAALQAQIDSAQAGQAGSRTGAPSLRNDPQTQQQIRSLFEFCGAGGFVDQMIATAQHLQVMRAKQLAAQRASGNIAAAEFDPNMLIAFAVNVEGGAGLGLSAAYGIYFTSQSGDFGTFGSGAIDLGFIAELAGGLAGFVYWAQNGKSALDNFSGLNGFATIEAGDPVSCGVTFYWPEDAPLHLTDDSPCGIGFSLGAGLGLPVNFFVGNSDTIINVQAPPALHGR